MITKTSKIPTVTFCLVLMAGCTLNQKIRYSLKDIPTATIEGLKNRTIDIEYFQDVRRKDGQNIILFEKGRETKINGKRVCINSEEHYKNPSVSIQFADVLAPVYRFAYCCFHSQYNRSFCRA